MKSNRKLGSYPGVLITASLTVALFLIGFCGWVAFSSKELIKYIKQNIEMQVYLDHQLKEIEIAALEKELKALPEIEGNAKEAVKYISSEQAASNFLKETQEDYTQILGNNPFRNAFSLKVKEEWLTEGKLALLKKKLEGLKGVYEVDYARDFVNGVISNANKAYLILSAIVIIFLIATILLIDNTIRLALYSQRFLIKTMQLVGATNLFIQKPFVGKGLRQGLLAGILASLLLFFTQQIAVKQIDGLAMIQNIKMIPIIGGILLILGALIGVASTFQSISRYLSVELDELY